MTILAGPTEIEPFELRAREERFLVNGSSNVRVHITVTVGAVLVLAIRDDGGTAVPTRTVVDASQSLIAIGKTVAVHANARSAGTLKIFTH